MFLEGTRSPVGRHFHGRSQVNPPPSDTDNRLSIHDTHCGSGSIVLDHVNDVALATAYEETVASPTTPTTPGPFEKANSQPGSPAIEESMEARLERLGRQRPEVFESLWAEVGFVFSISMSQVLSVIIFVQRP